MYNVIPTVPLSFCAHGNELSDIFFIFLLLQNKVAGLAQSV